MRKIFYRDFRTFKQQKLDFEDSFRKSHIEIFFELVYILHFVTFIHINFSLMWLRYWLRKIFFRDSDSDSEEFFFTTPTPSESESGFGMTPQFTSHVAWSFIPCYQQMDRYRWIPASVSRPYPGNGPLNISDSFHRLRKTLSNG